MLDLLRASETVSGYTIRVWTGVATDEGVGLIALVEVADARGVPVCRFEEFLDASLQQDRGRWPRVDAAAARLLQERAMERARSTALAGTFGENDGHRFDVPA